MHLRKVTAVVPSEPIETVQVSACLLPQERQVASMVGRVFSFIFSLSKTAIPGENVLEASGK